MRLRGLVRRGALDEASDDAHERALETVLRVGPFGAARGLSKLVRVRFAEPSQRGATMVMPLRWEATGMAGELFPVLDADLVLAADGPRCRLSLAGSYRPPLGGAGAALDRAVMRRVAAATVRDLLDDVAAAIAGPSARRLPGAAAARRRSRSGPAPRRQPWGEPTQA